MNGQNIHIGYQLKCLKLTSIQIDWLISKDVDLLCLLVFNFITAMSLWTMLFSFWKLCVALDFSCSNKFSSQIMSSFNVNFKHKSLVDVKCCIILTLWKIWKNIFFDIIDGFLLPFLTMIFYCTLQSCQCLSISLEIFSDIGDFGIGLISSCICVWLNVGNFSIQCLIVQVTTFTLNVCVFTNSCMVSVTFGWTKVKWSD